MMGWMEMKRIEDNLAGPKTVMKKMSVKVREERRNRRENPLLLCPVSRRRFRAEMSRQTAINNKRRAQERGTERR